MMKQLLIIVFISALCVSSKAQSYLMASKKINVTGLEKLCDKELATLRNEVYARHGYVFANEELQDYFSGQDWYKPAADNKSVKLNDNELYNVDQIKQVEAHRQAKYKAIATYFGEMKQAFATNDKTYINTHCAKMIRDQDTDADLKDYLATVLSKINPADIHYYRDKGLYRVSEDNGFVVMIYQLVIEENNITLHYCYTSHSEIIAGFDDCTDYMSEDEFAYMWNFTIDNQNNIKFVKIDMAG